MDRTSDSCLDALKWKLEHSSTTESQTFYLITKEGSFLILQMVYSSMSWNPNVQITARFYGSDGKTRINETFSCYGTSMELSSDNLSASCEQMSITVENTLPLTYKVTFQSAPKFMIDLTFSSVDKVNNFVEMYPNGGKVLFKTLEEEGFVSSRFIPKATVSGYLIVEGKSYEADGYGVFVHAIQHYPQCCGRWNFINMQGDKNALIIYQFELPDGYDYTHDLVTQACIVRDQKLISITLDSPVKHVNRVIDHDSGYSIPEEIILTYRGKTVSTETNDSPLDVSLQLQIPLKNTLDKIDILSELPFLLRKFIQTFITKPFVYSWMEDIKVEVTVGQDDHFELNGRMFIESTFLVEMP